MTKQEYLKQCAAHYDSTEQEGELDGIIVVLCRRNQFATLIHGEVPHRRMQRVANSLYSRLVGMFRQPNPGAYHDQ
jgi:hypothetical protein